jgi:hypothetical protein
MSPRRIGTRSSAAPAAGTRRRAAPPSGGSGWAVQARSRLHQCAWPSLPRRCRGSRRSGSCWSNMGCPLTRNCCTRPRPARWRWKRRSRKGRRAAMWSRSATRSAPVPAVVVVHRGAVADQRAHTQAQHLHHRARHLGEGAVLVLLPVPVRGQLGQAAKARLALAQFGGALGHGCSSSCLCAASRRYSSRTSSMLWMRVRTSSRSKGLADEVLGAGLQRTQLVAGLRRQHDHRQPGVAWLVFSASITAKPSITGICRSSRIRSKSCRRCRRRPRPGSSSR